MGPKKKKGGGKPKSPEASQKAKQLARLQKEQEEAQKKLEEEEKRLALEGAKIVLREQARRNQLLKSSCHWMKELENVVEHLAWEKRKDKEWVSYIDCNNLPIASDIPMINTYLFMLNMKKVLWNVENCFEMSPKLLNIIETLDDYIDNPLGASFRRIENWKEVRNSYRDVIQNGIDMMCYTLVRDLNKNLKAIDLWTYEFRKSCEEFFVGLWAFGEYPKLTGYPDHNFDEIGISVTLPEDYENKPVVLRVMKMKYNHLNDRCITNICPVLPEEYDTDFYSSVTDWFLARVLLSDNLLKVKPSNVVAESPWYDGMFFGEIINNAMILKPSSTTTLIHSLSKNKNISFDKTILTEDNDDKLTMRKAMFLYKEEIEPTITVPIGSLIDTIRKMNNIEFQMICEESLNPGIKSIDQLVQEFLILSSAAEDDHNKTAIGSDKQKASPVPDKSISADEILENMDNKYTEKILWKRLETEVDPGEINLRKNNVIGSLFSVELFELPEQEIILNEVSKLRTIKGEPALQKIDFNIKYIPPTVVEEKQEEEEGGVIKERNKEGDVMNKLMKVTVGLEENCLWFEPPTIVQWDSEKECWSDEYIVEAKYNEEKQHFTFKTGRLGVFGFMVNRYSNLPYQTWDLRPESSDTVLFNLTAATVIVDFKIKKDQICIIQIQNAPSTVLDHLLNVYMDPPILIKKMRRFGLDLFPDHDTFHYVEGSTYKDILLENHTYACMAIFSAAYNFTWSRWNSFAGKNKIVFQMRESCDKNSSSNYQMFLSSTERALIVDCTEVSPTLIESGINGMDFYPDLYSLICYTASDSAKENIYATHPYLVQTVRTILSATKIFTFS